MFSFKKPGFNSRTRNVRGRDIIIIVVALWLSLYVVTPLNAALFYTGNIHIESLSAKIDVTSKAEVTVMSELENLGDSTEAVSLNVLPSEATALVDGVEILNPVSFEPGAERELTLSYSMELDPSELQRITFDPMLFFDDMASSHRINSYVVEMILPEGVSRIVSSNKPYNVSSVQNGRLVITWQQEDAYPSALNVTWTTLEVDITAVKEADPDTITAAGEIVEVQITIKNQGEQEVRNLKLIDSFFPGAFEAVEPLDDFELVEPETSDPHLYWIKEIGHLAPGETKGFHYSVKVKNLGLQTRLDSLIILVDEVPVATSNDLVLYNELTKGGEAERVGTGFSLKYVVIGSAVLAGVVGGTVYYKRRKRSQANTGK